MPSIDSVQTLDFGTRGREYLIARRSLEDPASTQLRFPTGDVYGFWVWYASMLRGDSLSVCRTDEPLDEFPEPNGRVCLWYSGGAESTYTLQKIRHLRPAILRYEDYANYLRPYRGRGQVHLLLATVSASLGYSVAYLGIERNDLLLCNTSHARSYVERSSEFIRVWNQFHPRHRLRSCCTDLYKEQIVAELILSGTPFSSCDVLSSGWCRNCYKCFEAFYSAKAMGLSIGFRLQSDVYDRIYEGEYRSYVASAFRENPYNALQYFARLQILYGLQFERERDCG